MYETGAGTPSGELLRRYWQPVGLLSEATAILRNARLLGEDLVLCGSLDRDQTRVFCILRIPKGPPPQGLGTYGPDAKRSCRPPLDARLAVGCSFGRHDTARTSGSRKLSG